MGDKKKTDPIFKPADTHATGGDADLTTQDTHATVEPLDIHATGGEIKPLDTHATSEPAN
ncbi:MULTISPECIES: hypothetical protein [unclassified Streptomyces]|uniref:hypothetical protein n=1 Tax=unclassified Streptomyces TaxID=2593676 RepID=UPI000DAE42AA|nr:MULTISPECIES: hypothetical protein [unclassified Streptomyces]PZT75931.1 hypothetical protein DNK56_21290 [Streptomyces sp. AC1-42W]PZT80118.1 hypothetical protein DNK55_11395 [Streptomyces sp. AC1-42T]